MKKKILIADDSAVFRKLLADAIELAGYEVIVTGDGQSAVEKAALEKPDLVITDGLLPKMHGFLVSKAVKELNPAPKVIVLTAIYKKDNYKEESMSEYGADDLMIKPVKTVDLLSKIDELLSDLPCLV